MRTHIPFLASILAATAAANDTLLTAGLPAGARRGTALTATGDVDHDGTPDFAESNGIVLSWISGATGAVLRSTTMGTYALLDIPLASPGDLDGDGTADLVVGMDGAKAYSGANAQVLWTVPSAGLGSGHSITVLPDRDGDGVAEILVGVVQVLVVGGGDVIHIYSEGDGHADIVSGASGAPLATIAPPAGSSRGFGGSACVVGDLDGDGQSDLAIAPFNQPVNIWGPGGAGGSVRIYSGATLAQIGELAPNYNGSTRVTALGDLDGDGSPELALCRPWIQVDIVSAATGAVLRTHTGPTYDRFGHAAWALRDLDGDGVGDYAIGAPQPFQFGWAGATLDYGPGYVRAYSGASGAELWTIVGTDRIGRFGWGLAVLPDLDGDQRADLAVGSPDVGRVRVFSSSTVNSAPNAYCIGGVTTGTQSAQLTWSGTTSVSANDFGLVVSTALAGQTGLFVHARSAAVTPFGFGPRCVGAPMFRLGPVLAIAPDGSVSRALDFHAPPLASGPGAIGAGTTAYFQFLFRDPTPGHFGKNSSGALAVTFAP